METYLEVHFAEAQAEKDDESKCSVGESDAEDGVETGENEDEVFENIEEMEMDLCQLINETFKLDDDYWDCPAGGF